MWLILGWRSNTLEYSVKVTVLWWMCGVKAAKGWVEVGGSEGFGVQKGTAIARIMNSDYSPRKK